MDSRIKKNLDIAFDALASIDPRKIENMPDVCCHYQYINGFLNGLADAGAVKELEYSFFMDQLQTIFDLATSLHVAA